MRDVNPSRGPDASRQATYGKARRHSFAVAFLKRALPLSAFAVVGGFATAAVYSGAFEGERKIVASQVVEGEVAMQNPRLDGVDRNARPYAVTASAARQETARPAIVSLDAIDAKLPTDDGEFAKIDATAGLYDTKRETLTLSDGVKVRDLKGLDMNLREAKFDMAAGTMKSDAPVEVRSRHAAIDAESMRVLESGKRILFSRRVRMVIHNDSAAATTNAADKAALLGETSTSTAPWVHTNKLSVDKFAAPAETAVTRIRGTN